MQQHDSAMSDNESEIDRRRDEAIRRALNTPPKPSKEILGKTERAQSQKTTKSIRARRSKPKGGAAS
jgi:hypothetical protein